MAALLAVLAACQPGSKAPDISGVPPVEVHIQRFDQALMAMDSSRVDEGLAALQRAYPVFLPVYLTHIMNYGPVPDSTGQLRQLVRALVTGRDFRQLQDSVDAHFPDMKTLEGQLALGFRYIRYYFPAFRLPRVVTFLSGLANYGAVTADTVLGIGLDMFLGPGFPVYTQLSDPYPDYMLRQFSPEYIAADCFKVLQQQLYPPREGGTLLDRMIDRGKQLYFLDMVMPEAADTLKIGYTQEQLDWCRENEQYIWQYFVQNALLYTRDMQTALHYLGPGPNTRGLPPMAPGDIGSFVGWQIVRRYMERHEEVTPARLMENTDAQQILSEAHYRPH